MVVVQLAGTPRAMYVNRESFHSGLASSSKRVDGFKSATFAASGSFLCEYVGSFVVASEAQVSENARNDFVRTQLVGLRRAQRTKPVLLVVSLAGIKMCSLDSKQTYMAHALKRVSFATCDAQHKQFAFLAREPKHTAKGKTQVQYCHVFKTDSTHQADEINSVVGNAFRAAYFCKLGTKRPGASSDCGSEPSSNNYENKLICEERPQTGRDSVETAVTSNPSRPPSSQGDESMVEEGNSVCGNLRAQPHYGNYAATPRVGRVPLSPIISPTEMNVADLEEQSAVPSTPYTCPSARRHPRTVADRPRPVSVMVLPQTNLKQVSPPYSEASSQESAENLKLLHRSMGDMHRCNSKGSMRASIFKRLFGHKDKNHNSPNLSESARLSQSVVLRGSKAKKRRPVSELFASTFKLGAPQAQAVRRAEVPDVKSERTPVVTNKNPPLDKAANLCEIYGDRLNRTTSLPPVAHLKSARVQLFSTPGTGCGQQCQENANSPEMNKSENSEFLLPITEQEEFELKQVPWFCGDIDRQVVIDALCEREEGVFVVRKSASQKCCLALSVRVPEAHNPRKVSHYLVLRTNHGYKLKGFAKDFPSVQSLITHHTVMQEQLPCRLKFSNWDPQIWARHRAAVCDQNANVSEAVYGLLS